MAKVLVLDMPKRNILQFQRGSVLSTGFLQFTKTKEKLQSPKKHLLKKINQKKIWVPSIKYAAPSMAFWETCKNYPNVYREFELYS